MIVPTDAQIGSDSIIFCTVHRTQWPPEECGTYSADLKLEGELLKEFSRKVKQAEGDGQLEFKAVHVRIDKTSRVADILSEAETRTALGPHSSTGT